MEHYKGDKILLELRVLMQMLWWSVEVVQVQSWEPY